MEQFDYIVVGAGTAGCLLANRLSADPSIRVLLLEAGGRDDYLWIHIPVGYLYCIGNPRTDWLYQTEPEAGLNGRAIKYPRGKVLGGCSSINGMIYMRGQRRDYDEWAALGNAGWGWDEVLPYFLKHESHHSLDGGGSDPLHRSGGEWRVERQRIRWDLLDAFREAAAQVGIPSTEDFNRGDNLGCGYFEVNQRKGVRWNASKAFLRPAASRVNLRVVSGAHVVGLRFRDDGSGRIDGVDYRIGGPGGAPRVARAAAEVVMAAGAVGTPQLLELSGIGDPARLLAAGIAPRVDLPGVGENLQDHLQLRTIYKVSNAVTLNQQASTLLGKAGMGLEYLLFRRGPMAMSPSQLGAFAKSDDGQGSANLEYHVQPLSLDRFGEPLHRFPAFTASVCNLRPSSRGSIHVRSPDPGQAPLIRPNYLTTEEDRRVAAAAIRLTRQIVAAPALRGYGPEEYLPGAGLQTEDELAQAAGDVGTTIFHPVGTCRMGPVGDPASVVDAQLRCHRVPGLRIADASIMPTITSGNTNSPTLMIAERAAEMILADRRR
ncbi:GMC family oxidoreductase [Quisquiliibacterium transsilvanicum]|uniref:Choline dehydrogenase n=1 Tax=Quisquiliibacterium transsilvanicum TaxID=1549638 RepID=A0A7W8MA05_9BURK|nr:GMC family oxidoreductase N-terminal domain-containing protein [Quisquiliibacterium transsilvanicum]MBB5272654.1 choline dehydrogenase [Quisquiliibacterium transsilvanicum]